MARLRGTIVGPDGKLLRDAAGAYLIKGSPEALALGYGEGATDEGEGDEAPEGSSETGSEEEVAGEPVEVTADPAPTIIADTAADIGDARHISTIADEPRESPPPLPQADPESVAECRRPAGVAQGGPVMPSPIDTLNRAADAAQAAGDAPTHAELTGLAMRLEELVAHVNTLKGRYVQDVGDIVYGIRNLGREVD